ncbi:MAG: polysaccharide deacetylase family protein [Erysipelotrichales bacterium]
MDNKKIYIIAGAILTLVSILCFYIYDNTKYKYIDYKNITLENEIKQYQKMIEQNSIKFDNSFLNKYVKFINKKNNEYIKIESYFKDVSLSKEINKINNFYAFINNFNKNQNIDQKANYVILQDITNDYLSTIGIKPLKVNRTIENKRVKLAFLTFDDGISNKTGQVMDTLNKNKVNGTFFLIGKEFEKNKSKIKSLNYKNHFFGIHGYSHDYDKTIDYKKFKDEVQRTQKLFNENGLGYTNLLRSPYGSTIHKLSNQEKYKRDGLKLWDWNIDSLDWKTKNDGKKVTKNVDKQYKEIKKKNPNYITLLFHEYNSTLYTLPQIINTMKKDGYSFARIPQTHYKTNSFYYGISD